MRVFGGHDGGSGCSYYRVESPLGELAKHDGYEVTFADAGDDGHPPMITLPMLQGHDVVVAQRWNTHKGLGVWRRASLHAKLVYELDDDIFAITAENWQAFHLYGKPDVRDAIEHSLACADLVTVSTEPLAAVMREFNDNVAVLPNCIPRLACELPRESRDRLRIGWAGGASHGVDIGIVANPVHRFLKRFGSWDLQLNGTDYRQTFADAGVPGDRMHFTRWTQINHDPARYYVGLDYDIGLAPIWRTTFTDSKSGLRALEHGARGIPTIASDVPAYQAVIEHGVNGFLVRHEHEWLKYLSILAGDDALREKMGIAAQDMARRHLIEDHWTRWRDAYAGLFRSRQA